MSSFWQFTCDFDHCMCTLGSTSGFGTWNTTEMGKIWVLPWKGQQMTMHRAISKIPTLGRPAETWNPPAQGSNCGDQGHLWSSPLVALPKRYSGGGPKHEVLAYWLKTDPTKLRFFKIPKNWLMLREKLGGVGGVMLTFLQVRWCYAGCLVGWGWMLTFLALAHMLDAMQLVWGEW